MNPYKSSDSEKSKKKKKRLMQLYNMIRKLYIFQKEQRVSALETFSLSQVINLIFYYHKTKQCLNPLL